MKQLNGLKFLIPLFKESISRRGNPCPKVYEAKLYEIVQASIRTGSTNASLLTLESYCLAQECNSTKNWKSRENNPIVNAWFLTFVFLTDDPSNWNVNLEYSVLFNIRFLVLYFVKPCFILQKPLKCQNTEDFSF